MENIPSDILIGITFGALFLIVILILWLQHKQSTIRQYQFSLARLKQSFQELDEQAKLIVKTDLELNKAQEELDKRLNGLEALQKISRQISTTLDESEITHRLDLAMRADLDYEKNLLIVLDENKKLTTRINIGSTDDMNQFIINNLERETSLIEAIQSGQTFSSANSPAQRKSTIMRIFNVEHFVLSPILTQSGLLGMILVGNSSDAFTVTAGDEEIIDILANQIGQSLENARLFEEVYRSTQVLETKVQERTQQLEKALIEVQNISKTKSDFISAVSHELRTPLTSIKGYAAILMEGKLGEIPEAVHERLSKINKHSDNLVGLINDLLDISRIESGRVEMSFGHCNLKRMVDDVEDLLTPQMKEKNIQWQVEYDSTIPEMFLDRSQVERVFINLVGNATKFTPERGTISVNMKYHQEKKRVEAEVSDTGIGIPEKDIARLFDEFYRVENEINQNVKGTGLGLPLAKKIVEAHGGQMWVTSVVNQGTTFHFTLPHRTEEDLKKLKEQEKELS